MAGRGSPIRSTSSGCSFQRTRAAASSAPWLRCACGKAAAVNKSNTPRNPGRRWIQCGKEPKCCSLWIWEDLLNEYVEEMVAYSHAGEDDGLRDMLRQLAEEHKEERSRMQGLVEANHRQMQSIYQQLNDSKKKCEQLKKMLKEEKCSRSRQLYVMLFLLAIIMYFYDKSGSSRYKLILCVYSKS
uniref:Uncharacterized protein n=1 Tax=Oryza sativa subsp. japonica TaxID=39947 RepID=Q6Z6S6_ORYSJ|nr:hypothetical protein [Oryza sativa Japonica Group]